MNTFLLDFENIQIKSIKELRKISKGDSIVIFYSDRCKKINLDILQEFKDFKINLEHFKVSSNLKNALDFQLISYLGYLIGSNNTNDTNNYYIISKDKGYDNIVSFWRNKGIEVRRDEPDCTGGIDANTLKLIYKNDGEKCNINKNTLEIVDKLAKEGIKVTITYNEVKNLLSRDDDIEVIWYIINKYNGSRQITTEISRHYKDNNRVSLVYKKLKPLLKLYNKL